MRRPSIFAFAAAALATAAQAGTITGTIRAQGKEGAGPGAAGGTYESRKYRFVERIDYSKMRDFVVYLEGPPGTNAAPAKPVQVVTSRKVDQQGAVFSPHVLPIVAGTTVEWPNNDEIFHNVFSISDAKQFDLGLYKHPEVKRVTFDKAGRVDVFCSIHKAMNCTILVLENPHYAVADDRGRYTIADVPAGTYRIKAWHERMPSQVREIVVPATGEVRMDFVLGITDLPRY